MQQKKKKDALFDEYSSSEIAHTRPSLATTNDHDLLLFVTKVACKK